MENDILGEPNEALGEEQEPLTQQEIEAAVSLLTPILFQTNGIQADGEQMTPAQRRQIAELVRIGQLQHIEQDSLKLLETTAPDLAREHFQRLQMHTCKLLWHITASLRKQEGLPELRTFFIQNFTVALRLIFDLEKPAFQQLPEIAPSIAPLFQILASLVENPQMEFAAFQQKVLPLLKQINLRLRALAIAHEETRRVARKTTRTAVSRTIDPRKTVGQQQDENAIPTRSVLRLRSKARRGGKPR